MKNTIKLTLTLGVALLAMAAAADDDDSGGRGVRGGDAGGESGRVPDSSNAGRDADAIEHEVDALLQKYQAFVMGAFILVGCVENVAGYKVWPVTMAVAGAVAGGLATYLIEDNLISDGYEPKGKIMIGTTVAAALLAALLAAKLRKVGLALLGAGGGIVGAFALNGAFFSHLPVVWVAMPNLYLIVAAIILGVGGAVLTFKMERLLVILATAAVGAAGEVWGTKYMLETYAKLTTVRWGDVYVWAYLGAWIVLFLVGALVQHSCTAKKSKKKTNTRRTSLLEGAYTVNPNDLVYAEPKLDGYEHKEPSAPASNVYVINSV